MEVPDLLTQRLDEQPRRAVKLDGEDVAVFTRNRTFIYRGESLLRDAAVEVYGHNIERLSVSPGRRKTTFVLESVDGTEQFSVGKQHVDAMLEGLFGGLLASAGVLEESETIRGVYLFSDLTVVVTDTQLVKHIGAAVWDSDYETFPFEAVTGLDFEEGDVATQVVLWVEGRAERIKAPSDEAPLLQRTLTRALCEFHGVDSLEQFEDAVGTATEESGPASPIGLAEGVSPLIETPEDTVGAEDVPEAADSDPADGPSEPASDEQQETTGSDWEMKPVENAATGGDRETASDRTAEDRPKRTDGERRGQQADIEALERRVAELTRVVDRQNELLERQSRRLAELAERIDSK